MVVIGIYNGLVAERNRVDEAYAQIEVQLKRRHDLIPNLGQRGQGLHGLRAGGPDRRHQGPRRAPSPPAPRAPPQQAAAENMLTGALRSLFAVVENYPELKANQNVLQLQEQLTTTENQISFSRQHYNATVLDYNNGDPDLPERPHRRACSASRKREFFDAEPEAQTVPTVDLTLNDWSEAIRSARPAAGRLRRPMASTVLRPDRRPTGATRSCWPCAVVVAPRRCSASLIGCAVIGDPVGGAAVRSALAVGVGLVAGAGVLLRGRQARPRRVGRQGGHEPRTTPQLINVVQEMAIAADMPMPQVYLIDDTAPNAFATGPRSQARVGGDHDRAAREARPRGAAGRHRPRAVARPQLRHPVLADGRRAGRLDRAARRLLPALHVLGRRPARRRATATGWRRPPGWSSSWSRSSSPILAPIVARFVQLAVSRQREYLADASSVELTRNPYGLERALAKIAADHGGARGRQPRHPAPVLHNPIKKLERRASRTCSRPTHRSSTGSTGCGS